MARLPFADRAVQECVPVGRSSAATPFPPRPKIDELIREVRPDLFWNEETKSYTSSARDSLTINTSGRTHTVGTTSRPEPVFAPDEPKARLLDRRLRCAEKEGAFLALTEVIGMVRGKQLARRNRRGQRGVEGIDADIGSPVVGFSANRARNHDIIRGDESNRDTYIQRKMPCADDMLRRDGRARSSCASQAVPWADAGHRLAQVVAPGGGISDVNGRSAERRGVILRIEDCLGGFGISRIRRLLGGGEAGVDGIAGMATHGPGRVGILPRIMIFTFLHQPRRGDSR